MERNMTPLFLVVAAVLVHTQVHGYGGGQPRRQGQFVAPAAVAQTAQTSHYLRHEGGSRGSSSYGGRIAGGILGNRGYGSHGAIGRSRGGYGGGFGAIQGADMWSMGGGVGGDDSGESGGGVRYAHLDITHSGGGYGPGLGRTAGRSIGSRNTGVKGY